MPSSEGFVTTGDGIRLFYTAKGDGPALVLVPNGLHLVADFERLAASRTIVFYDVRNRGRSDAVRDPEKLNGGIHNDVEDLEALRRHFGRDRVAVIGHSYVGVTAILYAQKHPERVERVVQIGPAQPRQDEQYPEHLTAADGVLQEVMARLGELEKERASLDAVEFCRKFWSVLGVLYVTDPKDAGRLDLDRCHLENERNAMKYWVEYLMPSMRVLDLTPNTVARVTMPVLTVHGRKDRSAPFGGGLDWVRLLPNARLLPVEGAGHMPWIETPALVLGSIERFLDGGWPDAAISRSRLEQDALGASSRRP